MHIKVNSEKTEIANCQSLWGFWRDDVAIKNSNFQIKCERRQWCKNAIVLWLNLKTNTHFPDRNRNQFYNCSRLHLIVLTKPQPLIVHSPHQNREQRSALKQTSVFMNRRSLTNFAFPLAERIALFSIGRPCADTVQNRKKRLVSSWPSGDWWHFRHTERAGWWMKEREGNKRRVENVTPQNRARQTLFSVLNHSHFPYLCLSGFNFGHNWRPGQNVACFTWNYIFPDNWCLFSGWEIFEKKTDGNLIHTAGKLSGLGWSAHRFNTSLHA